MILTALKPDPLLLKAMANDWTESEHPRDADGRFTSGSAAAGAIAAYRAEAGPVQISRSGILKVLSRVGVTVKSNDPAVSREIEEHNATAKPATQLERERKEAERADRLARQKSNRDAIEAAKTPEQREAERHEAEARAKAERAAQVDREQRTKARVQAAVEQATTAPLIQDFPDNLSSSIREELRHVRDADGLDRVDEKAQLATVKLIADRLEAQGWTPTHVSKQGSTETSRYLKTPDGQHELRISDHLVPQTAQRESAGSAKRWRELIVGTEWRTSTLADYEREVEETMREDG